LLLPSNPLTGFRQRVFYFAPHATILTWLNLSDTNPLRIDDSADEQLERLFFAKASSSFLGQSATKFLKHPFWQIGFREARGESIKLTLLI
jgi:hypothetical protein